MVLNSYLAIQINILKYEVLYKLIDVVDISDNTAEIKWF